MNEYIKAISILFSGEVTKIFGNDNTNIEYFHCARAIFWKNKPFSLRTFGYLFVNLYPQIVHF